MTLTPEIIDRAIQGSVIKAPKDGELSADQKAFMDVATKTKELSKGMGLMTALMVRSVMEGHFEGAMSSCLLLIFLGYAIAQEEAKEVALAGAIQ
jgi:hypothetical protein